MVATVKINTFGGFVEVPSIASAHGVHLIASRQFKRSYELIEQFYGMRIATVTKRVGLAFLKGAWTGRTLKRFHDAHAWSQSTSVEESQKQMIDRTFARKWRAAWFAPTRYVKMLERK
jgi:hypothetical protein